jgi:osmotically-inducible protein OsmY
VKSETDDRLIEAEAEKRLQQSLYPEMRRVLCSFRHGILTLTGVVPTSYVRQIAQELVQGLDGVDIIDNQLVVKAKEELSDSDS